ASYTGIAPAQYAALFDTVYISLYKYFNAATGAVLAGSKELIEKVAHDRKLFGGGLLSAWPYTAVALHYLAGFAARFRAVVAHASAFFEALGRRGDFRIEGIPHGTNVYRLHWPDVDVKRFRASLEDAGILI